MYKTDLFPLKEKENLSDNINLSGPPDIDSKYTMNQVFNLHDPLDSIPLSKTKTKNIFPTDHRNNDLRSTKKLSKSRPSY